MDQDTTCHVLLVKHGSTEDMFPSLYLNQAREPRRNLIFSILIFLTDASKKGKINLSLFREKENNQINPPFLKSGM